MLAKAPPPPPPPPHPVVGFRAQPASPYTPSRSCVFFGVRSSKRVLGLVWRAGFTSTHVNSLSQPSAHQHTDDNDDDIVIEKSVASNSGSPTAASRGLAGGFGKLKVQKLRVLAKRASLMRQQGRKEVNKVPVEDTPFDEEAFSSDSELESLEKQKKMAQQERKWSKAIRARDFGDSVGTKNGDVKSGAGYKSDYELIPNKSTRSDFRRVGGNVSNAGGSASHLRGWNRSSSSDRFTPQSTYPLQQRQKISLDDDFFSRKSFRDLGCSDFMIDSLKGQLFLRPSHIQAMAFAPVVQGKSCVIADQSGSGKTLAYLIPIIQRLRQEELGGLCEPSSQGPRVLIMVPTAELATQVLNACRSMSKCGVPFRSMIATGGFRQRTQLENLEQGVDVLVLTPGRFMFLIKEGFLKLTNIKCCVLDEVDILFNDEDFEVALQSLMNASPVTTQYLFVTATLPIDVYNKLVQVFPDCEVIMGPGVHRTSAGLNEVLVDCSGDEGTEKTPETAFLNKKSALLQIVEQSPVPKTIVFCNKIETCRKVENVLKRSDRKGTRVRVLPFHAALEQESRLTNMKEFMNSRSQEQSLFLVCTDRASRGIDFAGVDHVVLFDFPRDPSEYVRRVGRTARGAGGTGKAFIFVVGKQVSLARRIIERNQKGHPLHDVPSAYELMR